MTRFTTSTIAAHARQSIEWIVQQNGAYRQMRKLRDMPDERLKDMGITRADADAPFKRDVAVKPAGGKISAVAEPAE